MGNDEHNMVLQTIFDNLSAKKIHWMVAGFLADRLEINFSKGIDLLVKKSDIKSARKVIEEVVKKNGFSRYQLQRFSSAWDYIFFKATEKGFVSLRIKLCYALVWRGTELLAFDEMYAHKVKCHDFYVPDSVHCAFIIWIGSLLTRNKITEENSLQILQAAQTRPEEFKRLLKKKIGKNLTSKLWPLLEAGRVEQTNAYKMSLRLSLWLKLLAEKPLYLIGLFGRRFFIKIRKRMFITNGCFFSILGPDGVGKSTFVNRFTYELAEVLQKNPEKMRIIHFRPGLLPDLKTIFSKKKCSESSNSLGAQYRGKTAGVVSSLGRLTYYWLDYVLGYYGQIRNKCAIGSVYIFDRYFYDFIVDPYRARIKLPNCIRNSFLSLTPKPEVTFVLYCDPAIIYARKQELTIEEIERELFEYTSLVDDNKKIFLIDASKSLDAMCQAAIEKVLVCCFKAL